MANKYYRKALIPSATTETTLYSVPSSGSAIVRSLRITNAGAARTSLTISVYPDGGATEYYVLKDFALMVGGTFECFNGVPLILQGSDTLKIESSQAGVHFYLSYLEVDRS